MLPIWSLVGGVSASYVLGAKLIGPPTRQRTKGAV